MKIKMLALAMATSTVVSGIANAAVITRTYSSTATYKQGPLATLTANATVTFDPTVANSASLVSFTGSDDAVFNNVKMSFRTGTAGAGFSFGGGVDGVSGTRSDTNDFDWSFVVDRQGAILSSGYLAYSKVGESRIYDSSTSGNSIVTSVADIPSAVPEPSIWMMMLVGFGLVGAATRYRRKSVKVRYA